MLKGVGGKMRYLLIGLFLIGCTSKLKYTTDSRPEYQAVSIGQVDGEMNYDNVTLINLTCEEAIIMMVKKWDKNIKGPDVRMDNK